MSVPKLRFPEFWDSGEWEEKNLGDICNLIRGPFGGSLKKDIFVKDGYAVYEQSHAIHRNFDFFRYYISKEKFIELKRFSVHPGDIIMSCSGTMGKFAIIPQGAKIGVINQALLKLTVKKGLDIQFIKTVLELPNNQEKLLSQSAGGAIKNVVSVGQIKELDLCIPSLQEQQKIADCLSSIDDRITAETQKLDTLKAHKKGLMQKLFPAEGETLPKLRFPEFRDAGDWEERRLGDVCDKIMDGTHFSPKSKSGSCLYLTSKNIQNGIIDLSNISYISEEEHRQIYKRCPVMNNDILLTKDGANTGNCAINNLDFEFSLLSSVAVLRGNHFFLDQKFLYQTILSEKTQRLIEESISGQAITRITLEKINNFLISIPDITEQQKIADCLSSIDEAIAAQSQAIDLLKLHKKGLMQQLFPSVEEVKG